MIMLTHHDDHKEKWQSHSISVTETDTMKNSLDLSSIAGYGETQEEALEEFKKNFVKALDELRAFERLLIETDTLVPIEVDCLGKEIPSK